MMSTILFKSKVDRIHENFGDDTIEPYEHDNQLNAITLGKIRTSSNLESHSNNRKVTIKDVLLCTL